MLAEAISSIKTAQWPKSPPPPPYSSGSEVHSRPFAPGFQPGLAIDAARLVPLGLAWQALALDEAAHRGAEHFVVFAVHRAR